MGIGNDKSTEEVIDEELNDEDDVSSERDVPTDASDVAAEEELFKYVDDELIALFREACVKNDKGVTMHPAEFAEILNQHQNELMYRLGVQTGGEVDEEVEDVFND